MSFGNVGCGKVSFMCVYLWSFAPRFAMRLLWVLWFYIRVRNRRSGIFIYFILIFRYILLFFIYKYSSHRICYGMLVWHFKGIPEIDISYSFYFISLSSSWKIVRLQVFLRGFGGNSGGRSTGIWSKMIINGFLIILVCIFSHLPPQTQRCRFYCSHGKWIMVNGKWEKWKIIVRLSLTACPHLAKREISN